LEILGKIPNLRIRKQKNSFLKLQHVFYREGFDTNCWEYYYIKTNIAQRKINYSLTKIYSKKNMRRILLFIIKLARKRITYLKIRATHWLYEQRLQAAPRTSRTPSDLFTNDYK
jgi:hypothetical protein